MSSNALLLTTADVMRRLRIGYASVTAIARERGWQKTTRGGRRAYWRAADVAAYENSLKRVSPAAAPAPVTAQPVKARRPKRNQPPRSLRDSDGRRVACRAMFE